jgi:hypothetical protein
MPGAAAGIGTSGIKKPLLFDLPDDAALPRLLELGCFFDFVWADGLLVVAVVSPAVVVVVEDLAAEDLRVVVDVDVDDHEPRAVVAVDEELLDDELDAELSDAAEEASVIWILRWPSLDSEFPSLTTKLKSSTSTPDGAW